MFFRRSFNVGLGCRKFENPMSDSVSFSMSDQRYFNFDPQYWNNVDPMLVGEGENTASNDYSNSMEIHHIFISQFVAAEFI